jgi:hypothetical protein
MRIGSASKEILGAEVLQEAIIIYKEDGIFIITGESDGRGGANFISDDYDPTIVLESVESLGVLNNSSVGFTNQGALSAGAGRPTIFSRPQVEDDLRRISKHAAFSSAFAVNYESEREFIFFTPETSADTENKIAHVYNYSTLAWSTWRKAVQAGHVLTSNDRLYLSHNSDKYILEERKSLNRGTNEDFVDEDIPITIDAITTTTDADGNTVTQLTVTYSYTGHAFAAGFVIEQGASRSIAETVTANATANEYTVVLRHLVTGFTVAAATAGIPIPLKIRWVETGGNPFSEKQFPQCMVYLEDDGGTHRLGFHSDQQDTLEFIDDTRIPKGKGWGSTRWGSVPWGDSFPGRSSPISTPLPREHQHARVMEVQYENRYARESVDILMMALEVQPFSLESQREPE